MKRFQSQDKGYLYERINNNPLERVLADSWRVWNASKIPPCLNDVIGRDATPSDRYVAASVVQWLGTNVGFSFLQSAFREVGYAIHGGMPTKLYSGSDDEPLLTEMINSLRVEHASKRAAQLLFDLSEPN